MPDQSSTSPRVHLSYGPLKLWQLALVSVATFGFYAIFWFHATAENFRPEKARIRPAFYGVGVLCWFPLPFMIARFADLRQARIGSGQIVVGAGKLIPKYVLVLAAVASMFLSVGSQVAGLFFEESGESSVRGMILWLVLTLGSMATVVFMMWGIQKPINAHVTQYPGAYEWRTAPWKLRTSHYLGICAGVVCWAAMLFVLAFPQALNDGQVVSGSAKGFREASTMSQEDVQKLQFERLSDSGSTFSVEFPKHTAWKLDKSKDDDGFRVQGPGADTVLTVGTRAVSSPSLFNVVSAREYQLQKKRFPNIIRKERLTLNEITMEPMSLATYRNKDEPRGATCWVSAYIDDGHLLEAIGCSSDPVLFGTVRRSVESAQFESSKK